ncbi:24427_t:CDS:2, partial [Dentiscutata erythropus]
MNSQEITSNESFSKLYNANNISVENSFYSARELLESNKDNKTDNSFENRYLSNSNVLQEMTIQASDPSHNQPVSKTYNIQEEKSKST